MHRISNKDKELINATVWLVATKQEFPSLQKGAYSCNPLAKPQNDCVVYRLQFNLPCSPCAICGLMEFVTKLSIEKPINYWEYTLTTMLLSKAWPIFRESSSDNGRNVSTKILLPRTTTAIQPSINIARHIPTMEPVPVHPVRWEGGGLG